MATRVAVAGVGAVGGLLAARLAAAGHEVRLLARGATLTALREDGLRLEHRDGRVETHRLAASDDPAVIGQPDLLLIATKAQAVPALAATLPALIGPTTHVLPALNGVPWWYFQGFGGALDGTVLDSVDPGGVVARAVPIERVVGTVVHLSAINLGPGRVRPVAEDRLILGAPDRAPSPGVDLGAQALRSAGFSVVTTERIHEEVWLKLWGNLSTNPVSALTLATMDRICADPDVYQLCVRMMREAAAVSERFGVVVDSDPDARMALGMKLGAFKTSMLQDREAGRRLELGPILGAVVEIADRLGVDAPFCRSVLGLARLLDGHGVVDAVAKPANTRG